MAVPWIKSGMDLGHGRGPSWWSISWRWKGGVVTPGFQIWMMGWMDVPPFNRNVISYQEISYRQAPGWEKKSLNLTATTFYWSELGSGQPRSNVSGGNLRVWTQECVSPGSHWVTICHHIKVTDRKEGEGQGPKPEKPATWACGLWQEFPDALLWLPLGQKWTKWTWLGPGHMTTLSCKGVWETECFHVSTLPVPQCWRRLLRVPWTARSNQSILKEINPEHTLDGLMLKLKLQYFGHLMQRAALKKTWCWERLGAGEGGDRGWDGWMASMTQWTWVWASSTDGEGQKSLCAAVHGFAESDKTQQLNNNRNLSSQ